MHSIDMIVISSKYFRDNKISTVLDQKSSFEKEYDKALKVFLPQGLIAFPEYGKNTVINLGKDIEFLYLKTDYYGGIGEQSAIRCISTTHIGRKTRKESRYSDIYSQRRQYEEYNKKYKIVKNYYTTSAINDCLRDYGIQKIGNFDEFGSIDLGKYKTNEDYIRASKAI